MEYVYMDCAAKRVSEEGLPTCGAGVAQADDDLAYIAFRAWVSSPDTLVNEAAIPAMWDKINDHGKDGWRRIVRALRAAIQ